MIDIKCDRGDMSVHMNGEISELCADLMCIIHAVYYSISEESMIDGLLLKDTITGHIEEVMSLDGDMFEKSDERRNEDGENE